MKTPGECRFIGTLPERCCPETISEPWYFSLQRCKSTYCLFHLENGWITCPLLLLEWEEWTIGSQCSSEHLRRNRGQIVPWLWCCKLRTVLFPLLLVFFLFQELQKHSGDEGVASPGLSCGFSSYWCCFLYWQPRSREQDIQTLSWGDIKSDAWWWTMCYAVMQQKAFQYT